ncbi:ndufs4 NADH dehydrogenase Fe-S protein subunit [Tilletia horrida]|uniref:NADH dehydrogenase [ubiquinone] iron-sulfur protein 4, mitochondrial n=1 Tax=Tilletia horrida TaxID=155126 RepID=A0AAN6G9M7_9BASI|nr:ndufs4 NADH dehydrogenase Fe-S protein subunit [Tilletia horrida]KAK0529731.1 ndufs4 NADH dehydrogenase Fe-S protein subunit [Tilletia horrida]KAK0537505.1 ndufs4 NADH dehydrogenase Fe-S protein subunit [Tilletia horrida]KAK0559608.1 ndufs4 NADH dehydrogenase Fe-S protein subunit [Tilletia horrida]
MVAAALLRSAAAAAPVRSSVRSSAATAAAAAAVACLHTTPARLQPSPSAPAAEASSSSSSSGSSSTGLTTAVHGGAGRNLPAEQAERNTHPTAADLVSDAPAALRHRSVRIFKPAKTATSSGKAGTAYWKVDFDILQGSARWENPLMGWASSGDYMQGTSLNFRSKEDAIHFCEKQGWPYFVSEPNKPRIPPKSYASNYDYISAAKVRIHHTK